MKEKRFRGKRVDSGAWIYGSLMRFSNNIYCIMPDQLQDSPNNLIFYEVDIKSVGQFIGIMDKNKTEVYENDCLFDGNTLHRVKHYATEYSSVFDLDGLQNITKYCEVVGNSIDDDYDELYEKYLGGEGR